MLLLNVVRPIDIYTVFAFKAPNFSLKGERKNKTPTTTTIALSVGPVYVGYAEMQI